MLDRIIELKFSDVKVPEFRKVNNKAWIPFGEDDKYPDYLLYLYNKSSKHNAIVNGKVNYIYGGGLKADDENDPAAKSLLEKCNSYGEGFGEVAKKSIIDTELFGGFYWQIIPDGLGRVADIHHLEFRKVRKAKEGGYLYKSDWKDSREKSVPFDEFRPKAFAEKKVPAIFFFGEYRPGLDIYCLPNYLGSINYIESDIEVSKHTLTNAQAGFSATTLINLFNGEPDPEKKRDITRLFETRFTGSEGKKLMISFNNANGKEPVVNSLGASDLTKENFTIIDNLISQNIYAGHSITTPELFGIQTPGKLGSSSELRTSYEVFKNTYANAKQQQMERVLNFFAGLKGIRAKYSFIPTEPVGLDIGPENLLKVVPKSWMLEKLGIDTAKYTDAPAVSDGGNANAVPQQQMVNDHLKNLTGRQRANMDRIIRKYDKGEYTRERAAMELKASLGLSDEDIAVLLPEDDGQQFSSQYTEEDVAELFSEYGEGRQAFEVIQSKQVFFTSEKEVVESELALRETFYDEEGQPEEAKRRIEEIKGIKKKLPQFLIRYSYEPRPGLEPIIETTRPFCRKLIQLDRFYSRMDIERISERVGYSVWDRRGGFWGDKPYCRHRWVQHLLIKK